MLSCVTLPSHVHLATQSQLVTSAGALCKAMLLRGTGEWCQKLHMHRTWSVEDEARALRSLFWSLRQAEVDAEVEHVARGWGRWGWGRLHVELCRHDPNDRGQSDGICHQWWCRCHTGHVHADCRYRDSCRSDAVHAPDGARVGVILEPPFEDARYVGDLRAVRWHLHSARGAVQLAAHGDVGIRFHLACGGRRRPVLGSV
mmetsp:Transcript_36241/g.95541  ORF Transcript_36241/g.95541 Transcript_36241/m.95541 type:complete len:201 (+) Transcript_36241:109-711(+)